MKTGQWLIWLAIMAAAGAIVWTLCQGCAGPGRGPNDHSGNWSTNR